MNNRMLARAVSFSMALGMSYSSMAQTSGPTIPTPSMQSPSTGTVNPPASVPTPSVPTPSQDVIPQAPPIANQNRNLPAQTPQVPNPTSAGTPTTVPGQFQSVPPGGLTSQGAVGAGPSSCPCAITTPNTRAPVGGCNC
jgi:hypothetical protein